ncbi:MAG: hypothetical protein J6M16_11120 [Clostridia bacterium]|nr:hypothetical protein [Clostridia bacterium]
MDKLNLGIAYHGNRLLSHVREDLKDIIDHRFNTVVHMFSHNDWDRSANIMKEIFAMTNEMGLDFWVDNWGLAGVPGDKSHFLCYHPEAHQYFSDGTMRPVNVCFNHESFISWTKEWIDKVYECGGRKIFWDEPALNSNKDRFSCACPVCKKFFKERYGYEMPVIPNKDAYDFQVYTIRNYFDKVTSYSKAKGMENIVCVMLGGHLGISLDNADALGTLDTLDNIGSDPYWVGLNLTGAEVYKFVYENTRKNIITSEKFCKNHNIWIQCYSNPKGLEEDVVYAAEAAYDAGARNILYWGFRGSEGNDYRAQNPDIIWQRMGDANLRILNKERDRIREEAKILLNLK